MKIGTKFTLWREDFKHDAYKDQMGMFHSGYVVLEQIPVTIVEVKKVKGMFGGGEYEGWKAVSAKGEEFTNNWDSFPDDSMTPTYYWDCRQDNRGLWRPVDACQAYGFLSAHVTPKGKKVKVLGAEYCKKHDKYFIKRVDSVLLYGCFKCYCDTLAKS